jgi:hypothetical protein
MNHLEGGGLRLADDEIAYLRYTCNLFFLPESPLYVFETEKREPKSFSATHDALAKKGLVDTETWRGNEEALSALQIVAECDARVLWQRHAGDRRTVRDFYVASGAVAEFKRDAGAYWFSKEQTEAQLVETVIAELNVSPHSEHLLDLVFSPGEYLVFAVFARDVRASAEPKGDRMTLEEVLACFDDESDLPAIPRDSDFQRHTQSLVDRALLSRDAAGSYTLASELHAFARGMSSETYDAFTRYDFIDEDWLIRETTVYPTSDSIYLLTSMPDGGVSVQELDSHKLNEVMAQAIATLPDISDDPLQPRFAKDFFIRA